MKTKLINDQSKSVLASISNQNLLNKISNLPPFDTSCLFDDAIDISFKASSNEMDMISSLALELRSWRKGPFKLNELFIDSEWQSFIKFNALLPYINLHGKDVADIGCNNGYYLFRMLGRQPNSLVGFDPSVLTYLQFKFIDHFVKSNIDYELLGIENLKEFGRKFDTIFCLGVLYHRSDPILSLKNLKSALKKGGEVIIDTMYIELDGDLVLSPKNSYSKIPNIYFIPTISALQNWCERAKFSEFELLFTMNTTENEQRKTKWICGQSLNEFLDPNNPNLTIEGYPAPKRVYVRLRS